jgi:hypothetical protein
VHCALRAALLLQYVAPGPIVFMLRGLAIGGIISKPAVSLVLGESERCYGIEDPQFTELCSVLRYVDDGALLSGHFCTPCATRAILAMYRGLPITFGKVVE